MVEKLLHKNIFSTQEVRVSAFRRLPQWLIDGARSSEMVISRKLFPMDSRPQMP